MTSVEDGGDGRGRVELEEAGRGAAWPGLANKAVRNVLSVLSNLPLAIGEMFTTAALMALGMFPALSVFFLFFFGAFLDEVDE